VTPVAKWPIACRNSEAVTTSADSSRAVIVRPARQPARVGGTEGAGLKPSPT
jgi:hypothetical protein